MRVFDPKKDGIDFWESLEGMRLSVADAVAVGPTNSFGEVAVDQPERTTPACGRRAAGSWFVSSTGPATTRPGDFNPERLILDDVPRRHAGRSTPVTSSSPTRSACWTTASATSSCS